MRQKALIGTQVAGRFTITRFLGEGGMATVYVASQAGEPREVALKIMNQELTNDRTFVRRFEREARASSRVKHPSSVHIIDYGVADGISYIAMELLVGFDLYALLEHEGSIAQAHAVRILIDVCDALMVAHELGIVHRDLKPENIMVVADPTHESGERVKVLDFGIAKLLLADAIADEQSNGDDSRLDPPSAVTRAGTFIGTPAYMSPEQCALLAVDTRADIYTCGVLLYQLVTGQLPFEGQTPLHTATLHIHQAPPSPCSVAPGLDPRLDALILKALAKRPADRPQTARHLGASLRKLLPDLLDARVGRQKAEGRGASSSQRSQETALAGPQARPTAAPFVGSLEAAKTMVADGRVSAPASVVLHEENLDSSDNLRTLVRASLPDLLVPSGGFAPPPPAPTFGRPPEAPMFGAPPPFADPKPFAKTEKSISQDLIPQARGQKPAPVGIMAAPPLLLGPSAAMPPPAPPPAPPLPLASSASWTSGSRGLLIGFAFGVTLVGLMVAAYVLLG